MATGLPVNRIVNVGINLSPLGAQALNFDSLLVMGDSNVINVTDRIRSYASLAAVATDFGTTAPEYLAALDFFAQVPQPTQLYIGRWAQAATHGLMLCGSLSATEQTIATWNAIVDGGFKLVVDGGAATEVANLNFSAAANLNAVATIINTAIATAGLAATCSWNGTRFVFQSTSTGAASTIGALQTAAGGDVDISATLKGTAALLYQKVTGIVAETAVAAVAIMDALQTQWYGLMFASTHIVDADHLAIGAYIEADTIPHVYGITTNEAAAITTNDTTSIGYLVKQLGYNRTLVQYCSADPYAIASFFGRAFTVDFTGNMTAITMMFQDEPGIVAENLTSTQANALNTNNYNYFAAFNNNTNIVVNGKVASGQYFDTIWGLDWLANTIQTNVYNALISANTKIPQTDAGMHTIATQIEAACQQGVDNGLLGPGVWSVAGFGQLKTGGYLDKGFYIYTPPISTQSSAARIARQSVPFQVAAMLAGAVQSVSVTVNVSQ